MGARIVAVIPARLGSKRFFGKVIHPFRGRPLLYHVWNSVGKARSVDSLVVATDSAEVAGHARDFGAEVVMTSKNHKTGSDRAAEILGKLGGDIYINVQADCLGLKASMLDRVIENMKRDRTIQFATLARRILSDDELHNPNVVKLTMSRHGDAMWFSRSVIPYLQHPESGPKSEQFVYLAHIGVYFFRAAALKAYGGWKRTRLEKAESLEQLRILENDGSIRVFMTKMKSVSIDMPRDLKKLERILR
jgi:3-deoxy-manno-octulosonate cytidylyltransferase (CMP-KDO synthetase)